jgi:hypothetical protein
MPLLKRAAFGCLLSYGLSCLIGCRLVANQTLPTAQEKRVLASNIAKQGNLFPHVISTPAFNLLAYEPVSISGDTIRVYIEGDGSAWLNSQFPSEDPTPSNPMALRLAVADVSRSSI